MQARRTLYSHRTHRTQWSSTTWLAAEGQATGLTLAGVPCSPGWALMCPPRMAVTMVTFCYRDLKMECG